MLNMQTKPHDSIQRCKKYSFEKGIQSTTMFAFKVETQKTHAIVLWYYGNKGRGDFQT